MGEIPLQIMNPSSDLQVQPRQDAERGARATIGAAAAAEEESARLCRLQPD